MPVRWKVEYSVYIKEESRYIYGYIYIYVYVLDIDTNNYSCHAHV